MTQLTLEQGKKEVRKRMSEVEAYIYRTADGQVEFLAPVFIASLEYDLQFWWDECIERLRVKLTEYVQELFHLSQETAQGSERKC